MPRKSKSPKPCPPGKERNQATGRCRNVKSPKAKSKKVKSPNPFPKIHRSSLKNKPPTKPRKSPKKKSSPKPRKSPKKSDINLSKNKSPSKPRKSPKKKSSPKPRKSPKKSDINLSKNKSPLKPKKVKKAVPDYIKYGFVKIEFGIKGPDPIYFSDYGSHCIMDSAVSWPNPKVPGSSRDKYNELKKRGKELGYYDFWITKDYFTRSRLIRPIDNIDLTNIKTVSMYIPSGMMVKIWTWDNDAPRVFKAGTYTDQSIVGSTGNGLCMIWGGHESLSDDIPDSFRMK